VISDRGSKDMLFCRRGKGDNRLRGSTLLQLLRRASTKKDVYCIRPIDLSLILLESLVAFKKWLTPEPANSRLLAATIV
jgi:hypothetical protein